MGSWMMKTGFAFALQLVICTSAFVHKFPRRKQFWLRTLCSMVFIFGFSYGAYLLRVAWPEGQWAMGFVVFEATWGVCFLGILNSFEVKPFFALHAAIGGYALQHLIYGVFTIVRYYATDMPVLVSDILYFLPYIAISVAFYYLFIKHNNDYNNFENRSVIAVVLAVIVIFLNVILSRLTSYGQFGDSFVSMVVCRLYSVICCSLVLFELFGLFRQNSLERDKMIMEHLLVQSKDQQRVIGDNLDFINIKCHDLKKQIGSLKQIASARERNEMIEELERSVLLYDSVAKTGNPAIDLVLTEISWRCVKNAIRFDYIIDGADYDFMVLEDVYSMFFNALDNAIESVTPLDDPEKRTIAVSVFFRAGLVLFQMENYYQGTLKFDGELPVTRKADRGYHGFGLKSIRSTAEKYGGFLTIQAEDGIFLLRVTIPREAS